MQPWHRLTVTQPCWSLFHLHTTYIAQAYDLGSPITLWVLIKLMPKGVLFSFLLVQVHEPDAIVS